MSENGPMEEVSKPTADRKVAFRFSIVFSILLMLVGFLVGLYAFAPSLCEGRELSGRYVCLANLNAIGKAILLYRETHRCQGPPNLYALVRDGQPPDLLACPSSGIQEANIIDRNTIETHCSYIFVAGIGKAAKGRMLLCYELPVNHREEYANYVSSELYALGERDMVKYLQLIQASNDYLAARREMEE